ncbi:MAG: hypothetical protein BWY76_00302 [bacterium ADurb.Bin429]|nr:MAG: hypothetical protein BWY76_00302 [bacterium ADurb.Bin429]
MRVFACCILPCLLFGIAVAQEARDPYEVANLLRQIPPLTHDATGRWPVICWEPFITTAKDNSFWQGTPLPVETYRELLKRGLAATVRLDAKYIPMALAIQQAGMPVIMMEGGGGNAPGSEAPDTLHKLPKDFTPKGSVHPCPLLLAGWHNRAMKVRETLKAFKDAGVTVNAAWLDWENEPIWGANEWEQSKNCSRCQELFPPSVLNDYPAYRAFILRFRQQLFSTYLCAPILEAYPKCSVTNWAVVYSTPERPATHYWGRFLFPPMDGGLFTATNPVAYGNDIYKMLHWGTYFQDLPVTQDRMDRLYLHIMFSQMSDNAENLTKWAPEKQSIPWVCRYCPDVEDETIPILDRARYQELLRHLWLRGADGLQVFNANRPRLPHIRLEEVRDAVASMDEMLRYRKFLEKGTIMTTTVLLPADDGAIWSGLRLDDEAIVRAFTLAAQPATLVFTPWEDAAILALEAPPAGATYHLYRQGEGVRVVKE